MDIATATRRMEELFFVDSFINAYDRVFVNLDAMLNTIMYTDILDELFLNKEDADKYCNDVAGYIKIFISKIINKSVIFYHSDDTLIEDRRLCKVDETIRVRVRAFHDRPVAKTIKKFFMNAVTKLAANSKGKIMVFNMKDLEPSLFVYVYMEIFKPDRVLVVSRDQVDLCLLVNEHIDVWDGVTLISNKNFENHTSNKIPNNLPRRFIPLFLTIKGCYTLDWGGVRLMGPKKTISFIQTSGIKVMDDEYLEEHGVNVDIYNCLDFKRYFQKFPEDKVKLIGIMKGE